MQLYTINTGFFKLDGGAMFGVVPHSIWKKLNPPDANNMCTWAMRSLLVENNGELTIIDTGIGNKQDSKFFTHYYLHGDDSLLGSLKRLKLSPSDIHHVFLTHLHFDHVGGAVERQNDRLIPTFTKATYWSNKQHWDWAVNPNPREKASFLKDNILPIQENGQLQFLDNSGKDFPAFEYLAVDGHTEKMMLPSIDYKGHRIVFVSDLIPSVGHLALPYIMAYDVRPLLTMEEKKAFLHQAATNKWLLFFQHDPQVECCAVKFSEKGVILDEKIQLTDI
jgi:glyoxylase-like metal-dependent hydrolase (beta-lactamase superfamily II)